MSISLTDKRECLEMALTQFTGTTTWYRHPLFRGYLFTDGVQFLAERADAYWLIDAVFSHQVTKTVRAQGFQSWTLAVAGDSSALLVATDGNSREIARQHIAFTDFPLPQVGLYLEGKVLLLRGEH